jgi:hypothetical protein
VSPIVGSPLTVDGADKVWHPVERQPSLPGRWIHGDALARWKRAITSSRRIRSKRKDFSQPNRQRI